VPHPQTTSCYRAGADQVVAAEMSGHMADAGGEVVAANGFGTRIMMIDKDARRMDVVSALLVCHQACSRQRTLQVVICCTRLFCGERRITLLLVTGRCASQMAHRQTWSGAKQTSWCTRY
jgi:hypothetical protein